MLKLVFVGTILSLAAAGTNYYHPVNQHIVDEIKEKATSWKPREAHLNPLAYRSYDEIKGLLGTILGEDAGNVYSEPFEIEASATFDARTKWGSCVHPIRDQKQCGSCWAFAGSEALSDRFCIHSSGAINKVLSPEDMVECDSTNFGCNGGNLGTAWRYLYNTGIVTDTCLPYTSGTGITGKCPTKCSNGEDWVKYKCADPAVKSTTVA